jgi:hypothetical protein
VSKLKAKNKIIIEQAFENFSFSEVKQALDFTIC